MSVYVYHIQYHSIRQTKVFREHIYECLNLTHTISLYLTNYVKKICCMFFNMTVVKV